MYTVRTLRGWAGGGPDLIWYGAAGNRTKAAITGFGIPGGFAGVLVRDDYGCCLSYDAGLAGVRQCLARLYRYPGDATRFDVPATNNGSENAVRGCKFAAEISGCRRTLSTLQRRCRIRSYLTTARSHGRHPLAAIRDALNGNAWLPPRPA